MEAHSSFGDLSQADDSLYAGDNDRSTADRPHGDPMEDVTNAMEGMQLVRSSRPHLEPAALITENATPAPGPADIDAQNPAPSGRVITSQQSSFRQSLEQHLNLIDPAILQLPHGLPRDLNRSVQIELGALSMRELMDGDPAYSYGPGAFDNAVKEKGRIYESLILEPGNANSISLGLSNRFQNALPHGLSRAEQRAFVAAFDAVAGCISNVIDNLVPKYQIEFHTATMMDRRPDIPENELQYVVKIFLGLMYSILAVDPLVELRAHHPDWSHGKLLEWCISYAALTWLPGMLFSEARKRSFQG